MENAVLGAKEFLREVLLRRMRVLVGDAMEASDAQAQRWPCAARKVDFPIRRIRSDAHQNEVPS